MPSLVETSSMVYDQKDICSIRLEMESSLRLTEEFLFASISIYPAAYIYIYPRLYLYLSPPRQYRQNFTKSWISSALGKKPWVQSGFEYIGFELIHKTGPICWWWRWMLGISDSLFTICQTGGLPVCSRRKQKLAEQDGSGQEEET